MTDPKQFYFDGLAEKIDRAKVRRAKQWRAEKVAASLAVLVVIAGGLLIATSGRNRLNVVAEARAALAQPGELIQLTTASHLALRNPYSRLTGAGAESLGWTKPHNVEQWFAFAPTRWRVVTTQPTSTAHGAATSEPIQCSYGSGKEEVYYVNQGNEVQIVPVGANADQASEESPCTNQAGELGTQPISRIETLLAHHALRPDGTAIIDHRSVARLVGHEQRPGLPAWPVVYYVDRKTYEPVRIILEMIGASTLGKPGTLTETVNFTSYERLPLNPSTERLLQIKPRGTPVFRHKLNEYERRERLSASRKTRAAPPAPSGR